MDFANSTHLDTRRLEALILRHTAPYAHDKLTVRIRHSRGADFSGTCYYRDGRIFVNVGRHVRYPYRMVTHIAKAQTRQSYWFRQAFYLTLADAYQLALFVYLHELFHYLVKAAGRSPGRKEAMCDRFAAKVLVDEYGVRVTTSGGHAAPRDQWDFKDLHAFVAAAPKQPGTFRPIPVRIRGVPRTRSARRP